jgi:hypothetical protein
MPQRLEKIEKILHGEGLPGEYAGVVSAAMEAMRLVCGEMSARATASFDAEWWPQFDFPFPEALDYRKQLNPLLGQYLLIRNVMHESTPNLDAAWNEALTCAMLQYEEGARAALALAYFHERSLQAQSSAMERVVQ